MEMYLVESAKEIGTMTTVSTSASVRNEAEEYGVFKSFDRGR